MIETKNGAKSIEDLKVGDFVLTRDNGFQPIRWLGCKETHGTGNLAPVFIAAGALGNKTNLLVSQQHRMLIRGWHAEFLFGEAEFLVAAKNLTNDNTIYIAPQKKIEYHQILFFLVFNDIHVLGRSLKSVLLILFRFK